MKLATKIGQIFVTHPKDQNYTSVYTENFTKHGQNVELFVILEIVHKRDALVKAHLAEYEKLAQTLVASLKRTYITAINLNEDSFEKALAAINLSLSRLATSGKVGWYGRLNVAVAAIWQNQMFASVTGNALVYLVRDGEFSLLSEGLATAATKPIKIFSNFSAGGLALGDKVILTASQLLNYLSLSHLAEFLREDPLREACAEIIAALRDVKTIGFGAFIFEVTSGKTSLAGTAKTAATPLLPETAFTKKPGSASGVAWLILRVIGQWINKILGGAFQFLYNIFQRKSKKYLYLAIAIILLLLVTNLVYGNFQKNRQAVKTQTTTNLELIETKLNEAEAALIYKDQNKAVGLVTAAEKLLKEIGLRKQDEAKRKSLEERLAHIRENLNHEVRVDTPTILTKFPNVPTDLVYSPNGFLGFNRTSGSIAFYDFRGGETKAILASQNTSNLELADYLGGPTGYIFLEKTGEIVKLDLTADKLVPLSSGPILTNANDLKIRDFMVFGQDIAARLYLLDAAGSQILRIKFTAAGFSLPEQWLKAEEPLLSQAIDSSVDGAIYVLYADHVDKFYSGQKQNFKLAATLPELQQAQKIFTSDILQFLYVLDPENSRIIIFNKQGKVEKQILSKKFRDLADVYVDEKNQVIYALSGSELLQVSTK